MDTEPERSPEARILAQNALVALAHALTGFEPPMTLIGGLVPEILARGQGSAVPGHLGTTDVDILLDIQVDAERDMSPIDIRVVMPNQAVNVAAEHVETLNFRGEEGSGLVCDDETKPSPVKREQPFPMRDGLTPEKGGVGDMNVNAL